MVKTKCPYCDEHGNRYSGAWLLYKSGRKYEKENGKKVKCWSCGGKGYKDSNVVGVND